MRQCVPMAFPVQEFFFSFSKAGKATLPLTENKNKDLNGLSLMSPLKWRRTSVYNRSTFTTNLQVSEEDLDHLQIQPS